MKTVADILTEATHAQYRKGTLFGVEIEVEDAAGAEDVLGWKLERDGSLRNHGQEYIFKTGYPYDKAHALLEEWAAYGKAAGFTHNYRTSLHIHVNVADLTPTQLAGLFCTYYVLEPMFFDDGRFESPYCIPISQASTYLKNTLYYLMADGGRMLPNLGQIDYKYMALGTYRLNDLGTFEFRMFNGANDAKHLTTRLDYIDMLVRAARTEFKDGPVTAELVRNTASQLITAYRWKKKPSFKRMLALLEDISMALYEFNYAHGEVAPAEPVKVRVQAQQVNGRDVLFDAEAMRAMEAAGIEVQAGQPRNAPANGDPIDWYEPIPAPAARRGE